MARHRRTPPASVTVVVPAHLDWRIGKPHVEAALRGTRQQGAIIDETDRVRAWYLRGTWLDKEREA